MQLLGEEEANGRCAEITRDGPNAETIKSNLKGKSDFHFSAGRPFLFFPFFCLVFFFCLFASPDRSKGSDPVEDTLRLLHEILVRMRAAGKNFLRSPGE